MVKEAARVTLSDPYLDMPNLQRYPYIALSVDLYINVCKLEI